VTISRQQDPYHFAAVGAIPVVNLVNKHALNHKCGVQAIGLSIRRLLWLAGDLDALKEHAWCNFEFLLARLHSSSVHALLNDLDLTLASVLDADIHLVLKAVASSTRILATDALQLASELIGRLRQLTGDLNLDI